jgi:hypothetical protein
MREYAFCLVVLTVCARGHLAVTFDLLFPAHVACLSMSVGFPLQRPAYPRDSPSFWIARLNSIIVAVHQVLGSKHVGVYGLAGNGGFVGEAAVRAAMAKRRRVLGLKVVGTGLAIGARQRITHVEQCASRVAQTWRLRMGRER